MNTYYFTATIGGTVLLKVQAQNEFAAEIAARDWIADDFNEAGPLRPDDVLIDACDRPDAYLSASLIVSETTKDKLGRVFPAYELAPDDPAFDTETA